MEWKTYRIGDLGKVVTGRTPPSSKPECFGKDFPFITPADMHGRQTASTTERYLSETGAALLKSNLIPAGSVAVSCIGWQMGKAIMTDRPSFTNQQLNTIIPHSHVNAAFLYYALCIRRDELFSIGSAAGVRTPILNKSAFSDLSVSLPLLPIQRKIATVLSAYDDLIEDNARRMAILEEMAQAVYREWFVNFRFPGHEKAKFVDSPLGKIPEGWEAKRLGECCELVMGQSPSSEHYNQNGEGLPFHQGVTHFDCRFPTHEVFCTAENRVAESGDILFSVRAPVGRINVADRKIIIGRGLSAIRSKAGHQVFLFHQLREQFAEEDTMGGGTIFKSVTKDDMQKIGLLQPPLDLLRQFECFAEPPFLKYASLTKTNANLRKTRDFLLPKLISGQVSVEHLDIAVDESSDGVDGDEESEPSRARTRDSPPAARTSSPAESNGRAASSNHDLPPPAFKPGEPMPFPRGPIL